MSSKEWITMMTLAGLPSAVAEQLVQKLSWIPSYGLADALAEHPQLAAADLEAVRSLIRDYREQQRKGGEEK